MNLTHSSELLSIAIQAALSAGQLLKKGFRSVFAIDSKPGKNNLVTEYDRASEQAIIQTIAARFPTHQFLAEESGFTPGKQEEVTWIIDPLDGTVNFANGIPLFSVSIAASIGEQIICGVVFQPITQELFWAQQGMGAFLNGNSLHVSQNTELEHAFLATGFPYNIHENPMHCIETFGKIAQTGIPIRRLGSAAIDLAYVAAGYFDGYWEVILQPWDCAAGKLLVEEAGGKVTDYQGKPIKVFTAGPVVASNTILHRALLGELQ